MTFPHISQKDYREDSYGPSRAVLQVLIPSASAFRDRNVIARLKDLKDSGDAIDIYHNPVIFSSFVFGVNCRI